MIFFVDRNLDTIRCFLLVSFRLGGVRRGWYCRFLVLGGICKIDCCRYLRELSCYRGVCIVVGVDLGRLFLE